MSAVTSEVKIEVSGGELLVRAPYHPVLNELLRRKGGRWDRDSRAWRFSLFHLNPLARALEEEGFLLQEEELEAAMGILARRKDEALRALDSPLLLPEQKEDARRALYALFAALGGEARGFLLANGTGTGKTYVYGAFLRAVASLSLPALLVVPNEDLARQTGEVLRALEVEVETTTYARLRPEDARGRVLVLDEAHLAKRAFKSERGAKAWRAVQGALFTLFATATPFDRPWESEYLLVPTGALKDWEMGSFQEFMASFEVYARENPWSPRGGKVFYFAGGVWDLRRFHETLVNQGFMVRRLFRPPEGLVLHEVPFLEIPREERELLAEVRRRLKRAAERAPLEERGLIMAQRTLLSRALLERFKLRAAFPLLEGLLAEGWHVALFLQYRSDRDLDFSAFDDLLAYLEEAGEWEGGGLSERLGHALAGLSLHLPSPTAMVRERFGHLGEALAFYTGAERQAALSRAKRAWERGEVRLLVATAAKGGTGLSLHDTTGKRPTAQVVLTLPWTGTQLDQILGRVVRVGLASPVRILLPAARVPAERKLAAVVAGSLRTLGHAVRGGEMPVPESVIQAFLHDLHAVDPEGFQRMLEEEGEE